MNYSQLKNEVSALGYAPVDDAEAMLFAANRALVQIFSERPVGKRMTLPKHSDAEGMIYYPAPGVYDLALLCPDFLGASEIRLPGARLEGVMLYLAAPLTEDTAMFCYRMPRAICGNAGEEIDVPPDTAFLLPLLTAAYLWLDDDPDKAQYYMSLYRDGMERIRRFRPGRADATYTVLAGWDG